MKNRYELALSLIESSDWRRFERCAQELLASELDGYRPMASASGDFGRDGQLYDGPDPTILYQFSVQKEWRGKVRATCDRVKDTVPSAKVLVYVTSQDVGGEEDPLKREIQKKHGLWVEVRGRQWLVSRAFPGTPAEAALEALAVEFVDPLLRTSSATRHTALSEPEARSALTYLELRWEDDTHEKGLTRLCYEALVRSILRDTSPEKRMARAEIHNRACSILGCHGPAVVIRLADAALKNLTKSAIRHWRAVDEFCLSHEETLRLNEGLATLEIEERDLDEDIQRRILRLKEDQDIELLARHVILTRHSIERFLMGRGEAFAQSVVSGNLKELDWTALVDAIEVELAVTGTKDDLSPQLVKMVSQDLLLEPSPQVNRYLGRLADSYTLMAFLQETPDVQATVKKLFAQGEVWLDSSVVLPVLADTLADGPERYFTALIHAAREAGIILRVTPGIVEEVERHLNRTLVCGRSLAQWTGEAPYLYWRYAESGRSQSLLPKWIEQFVGTMRPEEDLEIYLRDEHGILMSPCPTDLADADAPLWDAALAEWQAIHDQRRGAGSDPMLTLRLARHDAENHVLVVSSRRAQAASAFGYSTWWLTLDRRAVTAHAAIAERLGRRGLASPLMSPDFLRNYLSFGPSRRLVSRSMESALPVLADGRLSQFVPLELLKTAEGIRTSHSDQPERAIRRSVRDGLDRARLRRGPVAAANFKTLNTVLAGTVEAI